jgi:hypothetical protein
MEGNLVGAATSTPLTLRPQLTGFLPVRDPLEVVLEVEHVEKERHHAAQPKPDGFRRVVIMQQRRPRFENADQHASPTADHTHDSEKTQNRRDRASYDGGPYKENNIEHDETDAHTDELLRFISRVDLSDEFQFDEKPHQREKRDEHG